MKKYLSLLAAGLLLAALCGCSQQTADSTVPTPAPTASPAAVAEPSPSPELEGDESEAAEAPAITETPAETESSALRIEVQAGDTAIVFELNGSPAAQSLYDQLPLEVEISDYSTNEKIFYPPEALDTTDAPLADAGAGTLAYYAPWGDVVLFYDAYSENGSLYALGQAVEGADAIESLSGTVTIQAAAP